MKLSKKEKAKLIQKILEDYFPNPEIPLFHKDAYTLLIAVLLSAQTADDAVNKITPTLFTIADSPEKMIALTDKEIATIIKPLGLANNKAKAIRNLSFDSQKGPK